MTAPTYVYGLMSAAAALPGGLQGLGPSGRVSTIMHGELAAIVGDLPLDRPLGARRDLLAHGAVVDAVAASTAVIPMRFPAVVEERGVVAELLEPHHDHFVDVLAALEGRTQFTLKGRYEQDVALRELVERDDEVRALRDRVHDLPEDASYYDRVRLGELVVAALEREREIDAARVLERLEPVAVEVAANAPGQPEDVVDMAFLVDRAHQPEFDEAVEDVGRTFAGRIRFRLLGPLAPYDFVAGD